MAILQGKQWIRLLLIMFLIILGVIMVIFPKESALLTKEKGKSYECSCIGLNSWESEPEMGLRFATCFGAIHSCVKK